MQNLNLLLSLSSWSNTHALPESYGIKCIFLILVVKGLYSLVEPDCSQWLHRNFLIWAIRFPTVSSHSWPWDLLTNSAHPKHPPPFRPLPKHPQHPKPSQSSEITENSFSITASPGHLPLFGMWQQVSYSFHHDLVSYSLCFTIGTSYITAGPSVKWTWGDASSTLSRISRQHEEKSNKPSMGPFQVHRPGRPPRWQTPGPICCTTSALDFWHGWCLLASLYGS